MARGCAAVDFRCSAVWVSPWRWPWLHYADVSALYTAIGEGRVSANVVQRLLASSAVPTRRKRNSPSGPRRRPAPRRPRSTDVSGVSSPAPRSVR